MLKPRIVELDHKSLVGMKLNMSLIENKTKLLWQTFAPRIIEISNRTPSPPISLQVYDEDHFLYFNPSRTFVKWALVETEHLNDLPKGMLPFVLKGGLYAVFDYKGTSKNVGSFFQNIFTNWLPQSGYLLENRPHFEVLGEKYKNDDPNSEEEIWIPIQECE